MRRDTLLRLGVAALTTVTIACSNSSPSAPTPAPIGGGAPAVDSTLKATAPVPQAPVNSQMLNDVVVTLSASAAATPHANSPSLQYHFELLNAAGALVDSAIVNEPSWRSSKRLSYSTTYGWHVRAKKDDGFGPWSALASFRTPPPPDPTAKCGPPNRTAPLAILQCHRSLYPEHMSPKQLVAFMRGSTRHFNMARVPGGPFGLLRKTTGNNCLGFSCDVVCSGQGSRQKQYDVLINEKIAVWGGPVDGKIRVDECVIQR